MVQAEIVYFQIMAVTAQNLSHVSLDCHRHIADIQDAGMRTQAEGGFCHNRSRIRVVNDPVSRLCILFAVVNQFYHRVNGTQAVSKTAGAASFLAYYAVS